jgi:cation:H+ antiporter
MYLRYAYQYSQKQILSDQGQLDLPQRDLDRTEYSIRFLMYAITISLVGIIFLIFGADFLIYGASSIARKFGLSEAVIGLSLMAIGTSLPEFATAISGALHKNSEAIIGNVLGSNLFNILNILGITALIEPISVNSQIAHFDIPVALFISLIFLGIILSLKKIHRITGIVFLNLYIVYISQMYI